MTDQLALAQNTSAREVTLLPPRLVAACDFLARAQVRGQGWSHYVRGEPTLYHTALVASTLAEVDRAKYKGMIAPTVLHARSIFSQTQDHSTADYADLITLLKSEI